MGGWELEYGAEFVGSAEGSYTIEVEKGRKMGAWEEAIQNSYTAREAGKLVLSVDNSCSRRKKVAAYRYMVLKCSHTNSFNCMKSIKFVSYQITGEPISTL